MDIVCDSGVEWFMSLTTDLKDFSRKSGADLVGLRFSRTYLFFKFLWELFHDTICKAICEHEHVFMAFVIIINITFLIVAS